ncbi:MAG: RES family NAD+ phosphorylase [Gemmatimonadota bacterium]|jgi:RES domain-containing protein
MVTAWRIVKKRHAESAFDGEGARHYGGRWNSPGHAAVYVAESRALALLEILAGVRSLRPTFGYLLIPVRFDESLVLAVAPKVLPSGWNQNPPHPSTQRIGDDWLDRKESAILKVPSALVPEEYNYLLNPAHSEFGRIEIGTPREISIDSRFTE